MSIKLMSIVWEVPFPTSTQMLIALKLADYANDDGTSIFPANETLATKARCSETTVKTTLKVLRDCGLLVLVKQGGSGPRSTNEWSLNVAMLKALASGQMTIDGCSTVLEIDGEEPVDNKGSEFAPLDELRGQSEGLRGQSTGSKGSAHRPQPFTNHQLEPSTRERASEALNLDLKGSGKAQFELTPADGAKWDAWIDHLAKGDNPGLAAQARESGLILTSSKWPAEGSRVYRVAHPKHGLADRSKAMAGDAA